MERQYLLDTNICIYLFKGKYKLKDKLCGVGLDNCFISEITLAELTYGARKCQASFPYRQTGHGELGARIDFWVKSKSDMQKKKIILLLILCLVFATAQAQNSNQRKTANQALRDSLAAATEVLAYHPDSIDLRLKKAAWNIQLEQWDYAKDDLDKVLFLNNTNIAGLYYRAFVNEKLKRYNFARLDYQNLLVLVPGNFQAQLGLALLNEKDKHHTEAYDGLNSLIEQYPDSALAYAARGGLEKERGMLELAEYDYAEAMKRDAKNTDYIINHADILITLGRKLDALEDLEKLRKLGIPMGQLGDFYIRIRGK